MFSCKYPLLTLVTSVLMLLSSVLPALAQKLWEGKGRIISGEGEGASVGLKIVVEEKQVTFLSGVSQGQQIELFSASPLKGEVKLDAGIWSFLESGRELGITLAQDQPDRLIHYRLFPVPEQPNNEG